MPRFAILPTVVLVMLAAPLAAQGPLSAPDFPALIAQLDAHEYADREAASRRLMELGDDARPAVEAAQKHPSAEVRFRIAIILERLRTEPLRKLRAELVEYGGTPEPDVEQGMILLSRILDMSVKPKQVTKQLEGIAAKVRERLGKDVDPATAEPQRAVDALRQVLFTDLGFQGNEEDYGNPDNCSLAKILETKKGRPIFISQLMIAVARRLKIPIVGLPVAGMYIVKYDGSQAPAGFPRSDIFIHPYEKGRILRREDRRKDYPGYDPDVMVPPGTRRETLERMLNNVSNTLGSRAEPGDDLRRELVAAMEQALAASDESKAAPLVPIGGFRGGRREGLPIGDY